MDAKYDSKSETSPLLLENASPKGFFQKFYKTLVAGVGFMCDAYDLFVINLVIVIMKGLYSEDVDSAGAISTAALWGAVFGQLLFGLIADKIGRRIGFIVTLSLVTVGALVSAASYSINSTLNIFITLSVCRFVLGVGIGGEYPLSATISSESSEDNRQRGRQVAAVFSMQGVGILLAPLTIMLLLLCFGQTRLDWVWRMGLGLGALPGLVMLYSRIRMKETRQFTEAMQRKKIPLKQIIAKYWMKLLGTAGTWLIFDITFYANGLFNATILNLFFAQKEDASQYDTIWHTTTLSCYLALMGLPGYYVAIFLVDVLGRKLLMLGGFAFLGIVYIIMGVLLEVLLEMEWLFMVLYGLSFFFSNVGPNTVTFVIPSEVFPTQVRATCHGISAAAGKIGAAIGGILIQPLFEEYGLATTLIVCGCVSFSGFIVTWFLVEETKGKPLKEEEAE